MTALRAFLPLLLLLAVASTAARANPAPDDNRLPSTYIPSGERMFKQYCAACHGADAKGNGPVRAALKVPAPNLTTLAKRHGGKFPNDYVTGVLRFGPGVASHGSADMPTWGPIFEYLDNHSQSAAQQRIKNLCDYLASLQEK